MGRIKKKDVITDALEVWCVVYSCTLKFNLLQTRHPRYSLCLAVPLFFWHAVSWLFFFLRIVVLAHNSHSPLGRMIVVRGLL
jgi:hypothetical protein